MKIHHAPKLTPLSGEITGHLFENPQMGVSRSIYWSCNVNFEPISAEGEDWPCVLLCDWITWPIRHWHEIDGMTLAKSTGSPPLEASLYFFAQHQPLSSIELSFSRMRANQFRLRGSMVADLSDVEGRSFHNVVAELDVIASFTGLAVVPENLSPKPTSEAAAREALRQFADLSGYEPPERGDVSWEFRPKVEHAAS